MIEALDSKNSIATKSAKGVKHAQKSTFADFINNLGKTTNAKKISAESNKNNHTILGEAKNLKDRDTSLASLGRNDNIKVDSAPKSEILSNILKGKNEEILQNSAPKSPLESILSRPQATQTKLNQTPQIKNSAEPQPTQNFTNTPLPRAHKEAKLPHQNPQDLPKNKVEIPLDSAPKSAQNSNPALENPQKSPLDSTPKTTILNETKNQKNITLNDSKEPKNDIKDSLLSTNAQNDKGMLDSAPKAPKIESARDFNPVLENTQKDSVPKIAENPQKSPLDSANLQKEPPTNSSIVDEKSGLRSHERGNRTNGSLTKRVASLPDLSPQDEFAPNLGIKNTLKYGAFKAFDALSLLKPSDGKKLSDLIKKADELALNLQSIKYTKMGENKGVFGLDSAKQNLDKIQSREAQPLKASSGEGVGVVRDGEGSDFAIRKNPRIQAPAPSLKENARGEKGESKADLSAQGRKENRDSSVASLPQNDKVKKAQNDKVKEVSDSIKVDTTKTNSAESKGAESPLKSALETENSDIKPINLKTQNIAESKKETTLESIKDAIKDSAKDIKDTPKPTQENAPLTDAQSTSKIANKMFDARESMRHFAYALKQEIQNHKPPLSKITIELQPANLGSVEVSIISQGKNIQIQLHSNQQTLNLFIQNQSDLRSALSQIGYENVAMSFNNGAQMGFSDNSGKWRYESAQKSRNTFSFNESSDEGDEVFEIMITNNYA